jgi:hypothetical protein
MDKNGIFLWEINNRISISNIGTWENNGING